MADPLVRRVRALAAASSRRTKKWTYLTWCDLRNHPLMLVGALLGAIAFTVFTVQQQATNSRVTVIEKTVKVPRRCQIAAVPGLPTTVILTCIPATKAEVARANRPRPVRAGPRRGVRTRGQNGGPLPRGQTGSRNGSQGIAPSPSHTRQPSSPPAPSRPPSGGGSPSPPSSPSPRASPAPGLTTPPVGPIPSLTIPLPSPSLPPPPHLPGS